MRPTDLALGLGMKAIGAMAVADQNSGKVFEQLPGRLHAAGRVDHEKRQLRSTQHPQPEPLGPPEVGGFIGVSHRRTTDGVGDVIHHGFQPLGDRFLGLAEGTGTEVQPPLHLQKALDGARTEAEMTAHQGNPGDQTGTHLAAGNLLWEPGRDRPLTAQAGAPEALMFGDGKRDLRQIEDLMSGRWIRIDDDLAAAFAAGLGKMALDAVHLGFRNPVSGVGDMAILGAPPFARGLAREPVFGFCREPVLTGRQRGITGIERQLFAAVLEQTPERVDDLLGLVQGRGALRGFEKGVGQIHGAIVSAEFIGTFLPLSRARGDEKFGRRRPSAEDKIGAEQRYQRAERVRQSRPGKVGEIREFAPETVSSGFCDFSRFFSVSANRLYLLQGIGAWGADLGRYSRERLPNDVHLRHLDGSLRILDQIFFHDLGCLLEVRRLFRPIPVFTQS